MENRVQVHGKAVGGGRRRKPWKRMIFEGELSVISGKKLCPEKRRRGSTTQVSKMCFAMKRTVDISMRCMSRERNYPAPPEAGLREYEMEIHDLFPPILCDLIPHVIKVSSHHTHITYSWGHVCFNEFAARI